MKLNKKKIYEIQKNRPPYLFVDSAEVINFRKSNGKKKFFLKDFIFKLHWPKDPNLPAAIHLECMTQTASLALLCDSKIKDTYCYVSKVENLMLKKKIVPPIKIYIFTEILKYSRGIALCKAEIKDSEDNIYSNSTFTLIIPSVIKNLSNKLKV